MKIRFVAILVFIGLLALAFSQLPPTPDPRCPHSTVFEFSDGALACVNTLRPNGDPIVLTNLRTGEVKTFTSKDVAYSMGDDTNSNQWDGYGVNDTTIRITSKDWRFVTVNTGGYFFHSDLIPFAEFKFTTVNKDLLEMSTQGSYFDQSQIDPNMPDLSHLYTGKITGHTTSVLKLDGLNLIIVWTEERTVFVPVAEFSYGQHLGIYPEWPNGFPMRYRLGGEISTVLMDQKNSTVD